MIKRKLTIELYQRGLKLQDIASKLGTSINSVKGMIYRHVKGKRKPRKNKISMVSKERINRIITLINFNDGSSTDYTIAEISNDVGLSVEVVREVIRMIEYERKRDRENSRIMEGKDTN